MKKMLKMTAAASMVGLLALAAAGCGGGRKDRKLRNYVWLVKEK